MESASYWPGLCGNRTSDWAYWSNEVTWNTSSPDLTTCFQKTALQWLPCGFLWLCSAIYLPMVLRKRKNFGVRTSRLNCFKLFLTLLLAVFAIAQLIKAIVDAGDDSRKIPPVLFINPVIETLSMLLLVVLIRAEYRRGEHSSGPLFLFWLLQLVCHLFIAASQITRLSTETADSFVAGFGIASAAVTLVQFLAHCFADHGALQMGDRRRNSDERKPLLSGTSSSSSSDSTGTKRKLRRPCPELRASFLARLTFTWISNLVLRGYRRALTSSDLWDLRPVDSSPYIVPRIEAEWNRQIKKSKETLQERFPSKEYRFTNITDNDKNDAYSTLQEVQSVKKDPQKSKYMPSVFTALRNVFGPYYMLAGMFKLITDLMNFLQPQLLKALIAFVSDVTEYEWHGYILAIGLFLIAMMRTMIFQQYWHGCYVTGMRLRTAVIALVYRKALRLSGTSRKDTTVGEIVNLMSVDAQKLQDAPGFMHMLWTAPITIVVAMVFLWQELGASSLAGVGVMIFLIPINGIIASKIKRLQVFQMRLKDQRMKLMNEILNGIKVLKLYAWESSFQGKISDIRNQELKVLRTAAYLNAASAVTWFCAPFLVALMTFAVYVLSSPKNILTSEKAFVSLSLFNIMNFPLAIIPGAIAYLVQLIVSIRRIDKYLIEEELDPGSVAHNPLSSHAIRIDNGSFAWDEDAGPVLRNINLSVPDGKLYAVVGTVGCGKSSLVNSILGELRRMEGKVVVKGSVAYVPQQAWCQNCSLQDNILFGRNMHRNKYNRVLDACALKPDLKVLTAGDRTEIGEKGINLSGGQKQRVSLARAVYQDSDIYLLDDPLSAVDSHVGKHLFEQVISQQGLLANKTRILVTHGLNFLPKVDCIVVLKEGVITEIGSYAELLSHDGAFAEFIRNHLEKEAESEEEEDEDAVTFKKQLRRTISMMSASDGEDRSRKSSHAGRSSHHRRISSVKEDLQELERQQKAREKLMTTETAETGSVKLAVFLEYIKAVTAVAAVALTVSYLCYIVSQVSTNIWLSVWSEDVSAYNDTAKRDLYLGVYGALGAGQAISIMVESVALAYGTYFASRHLHHILLSNVMRTPMTFFDTTPLGRILNRFGKDVDTVDLNIPMTIRSWLATMASVIGTLIVVTIASPIFLAALVPLSVCYYFVQRFYICTSRQLKRIDSVKRSPIYSHFQESVVGAASIRAYGREKDFIGKSDELVDENQMIWYPNIVSYRWLGVFLETIGNLIILFAAVFSVVSRSTIGAGLAGASVTYSLQVTGALNFSVRMTCDMEAYVVAVERILEYAGLSTEAPLTGDVRPPSSWPARGRIEFRDYSVRYRPGLDLVLKRINAVVNPGEMVGIVGRTGAGKSSLTMALFRILEPAGGDIIIDDINVMSLGLHDLRSRLTIIPQDPVLFSGSLRMNLDPFDAHSDGQVWTALEQAHLKAFVAGLPDGLQHKCSEGGDNLSVGQRQLVCLARALLRKTKVLVLDEATAAVDLETDDLIQNTIRREFKGCTILTIAHRLNTIMDYDRIMVLDCGQVKEFDSPTNLLKRPNSIFYGMCNDAGLV